MRLADVETSPALDRAQNNEINQLKNEVAHNEKWLDRILLPITVLLAILALGGGLGVVFSIRDQRRISQLHQLTVTGELSSQRRSEQSYASFLEQSQTTLSLVNDTLRLGKEATDTAAHGMQQRAQARIDAVEERAQRLMLDIFASHEFELVVEDPARRSELHSIADDLRSMEGYLSLQDMKLPPYTRFVKAVVQFLDDETEAARKALQVSSQERIVGDLAQFVEYWLGYVLSTVGEYEEALNRFGHDEVRVPPQSSQFFQLERIIHETTFFALARTGEADAHAKGQEEGEDPHARLRQVAEPLDHLAERALEMGGDGGTQAKHRDRLEVARTRADILEWVAYDPCHLDTPIAKKKRKRAAALLAASPPIVGASELLESDLWDDLEDPDLLRYWALGRAKAICEEQAEPSIDVAFALAECNFKLGERDEAEAGFGQVESKLHRQFGAHLEKRRVASLHQSLLISHVRLHQLRAGDSERQSSEARGARRAQREAHEALRDMEPQVTVFSQIQRRNLSREEFETEIDAIVEQAEIEPGTG